jgi:pimeloyl-ACP methyl ester carboxylesterase
LGIVEAIYDFLNPKERKPGYNLFRVKTRDGVIIALHNYLPGETSADRHPALLVHGLGSNRFDLDYPGRQNLARYLYEKGYDVWVVELRGAGESSSLSPLEIIWPRWAIDDYVVHDLPAAIQSIREITDFESIHWVGHSLGGMLAYPFLVSSDRKLVRSCVTVGAPSMALLGGEFHDLFTKIAPILKVIPYFPYSTILKLSAPLMPIIAKTLGRYFFNPENMDISDLKRLAKIALHNVPSPMLIQAFDWYDSKHFRSYYKTFSFRENLYRIETPLLIIAGAVDRLTPPDDLKYVFDHISSEEKEFLVMGKDTGCQADYGHVDLILGVRAPREVYPKIYEWLERHD